MFESQAQSVLNSTAIRIVDAVDSQLLAQDKLTGLGNRLANQLLTALSKQGRSLPKETVKVNIIESFPQTEEIELFLGTNVTVSPREAMRHALTDAKLESIMKKVGIVSKTIGQRVEPVITRKVILVSFSAFVAGATITYLYMKD